MPAALPQDELLEKIADAHFVGIRSRSSAQRQGLRRRQKANQLSAASASAPIRSIMQAATEHGVIVFNAPYSNTRSVAELVIAEAIMLMRGIPDKSAKAHRGEWLKSASRCL